MVTNGLKAHCHGADWIDKPINLDNIMLASVILLYTEIHEDDSDLTAFILETKYDPKA